MAAALPESPDFDVVIIGGGWAGIVMCKYALEVGLTVRVLEARDDIGGVWYYSDDPKQITVMKGTVMSSSTTTTEMSDFPMPRHLGDFLTHEQVFQYLKAYCNCFNLLPHIELSTSVNSTERMRDKWLITASAGRSYTATNLVVCTGGNRVVNRDLEWTLLREFKGGITHSGELKHFSESHRDKVVMVIGGGETASDIVESWRHRAKRIVWSIPNGQQFFRKYAKLLPHRQPQALDKASSILLTSIAPHPLGKPGLAWICKWTTNGSLLAYQGHGIPEFRNEASYLRQFVNKHAHVLDHIDYDHVIPKGKISNVNAKTVTFQDGSTLDVDHVILCTGYKGGFSFLPSSYRQTEITDCFKYCLHASDPTLAYVGFARPVIGSIPMLIEFQCQMLGHMWSGRVPTPNLCTRISVATADREKWKNYFGATSRRVAGLVDAFDYAFDVMRYSKTAPNHWNLFLSSPRDYFTVISAPGETAYCRVNDPNTRAQALATMRHHSGGTLTPFHLLLIVFLRLIWFDWILDRLCDTKYVLQRNSLIRRLTQTHLGQAANHVWTWPKRKMFDNQSHHLIQKKTE